MLLVGIAVAYATCAALPALPVVVTVLALLMLCLGLGNGAVFQMVPQRFAREIGLVTGVVGAVGGIGGFILPNVLGQARAATGSFSTGFVILTLLAGGAVVLLRAGLSPAEVAATAGYADQPHLSRETRALAGASPGQLAGPPPDSGANRSTPLPSGSSTTA